MNRIIFLTSLPCLAAKFASTSLYKRELLQVDSNANSTEQKEHRTAYYGDITVGNQSFVVVFDTGSGNLILPSAECQDSACKKHSMYDKTKSNTSKAVEIREEFSGKESKLDTLTIAFGTGEIQGRPVRDRVCIGTLCTDELNFIHAHHMTENPFGMFPFDGVMGLALPNLAETEEFSVFKMFSSRLQDPVFSVYLSDDPGASEITFGQIKQEHSNTPLLWVPVSAGADKSGYWQVEITSVIIGDEETSICNGCQVAVDTGTSELAGPTDVVNKLKSKLSGIKCNDKNVQAPMLGFRINDDVLWMPAEEYLDVDCKVKVMPLDVDPPIGPLFVFGDPFLRSFFSAYALPHAHHPVEACHNRACVAFGESSDGQGRSTGKIRKFGRFNDTWTNNTKSKEAPAPSASNLKAKKKIATVANETEQQKMKREAEGGTINSIMRALGFSGGLLNISLLENETASSAGMQKIETDLAKAQQDFDAMLHDIESKNSTAAAEAAIATAVSDANTAESQAAVVDSVVASTPTQTNSAVLGTGRKDPPIPDAPAENITKLPTKKPEATGSTVSGQDKSSEYSLPMPSSDSYPQSTPSNKPVVVPPTETQPVQSQVESRAKTLNPLEHYTDDNIKKIDHDLHHTEQELAALADWEKKDRRSAALFAQAMQQLYGAAKPVDLLKLIMGDAAELKNLADGQHASDASDSSHQEDIADELYDMWSKMSEQHHPPHPLEYYESEQPHHPRHPLEHYSETDAQPKETATRQSKNVDEYRLPHLARANGQNYEIIDPSHAPQGLITEDMIRKAFHLEGASPTVPATFDHAGLEGAIDANAAHHANHKITSPTAGGTVNVKQLSQNQNTIKQLQDLRSVLNRTAMLQQQFNNLGEVSNSLENIGTLITEYNPHIGLQLSQELANVPKDKMVVLPQNARDIQFLQKKHALLQQRHRLVKNVLHRRGHHAARLVQLHEHLMRRKLNLLTRAFVNVAAAALHRSQRSGKSVYHEIPRSQALSLQDPYTNMLIAPLWDPMMKPYNTTSQQLMTGQADPNIMAQSLFGHILFAMNNDLPKMVKEGKINNETSEHEISQAVTNAMYERMFDLPEGTLEGKTNEQAGNYIGEQSMCAFMYSRGASDQYIAENGLKCDVPKVKQETVPLQKYELPAGYDFLKTDLKQHHENQAKFNSVQGNLNKIKNIVKQAPAVYMSAVQTNNSFYRELPQQESDGLHTELDFILDQLLLPYGVTFEQLQGGEQQINHASAGFVHSVMESIYRDVPIWIDEGRITEDTTREEISAMITNTLFEKAYNLPEGTLQSMTPEQVGNFIAEKAMCDWLARKNASPLYAVNMGLNCIAGDPNVESHMVTMTSHASTDDPEGSVVTHAVHNVNGHVTQAGSATTLNGQPLPAHHRAAQDAYLATHPHENHDVHRQHREKALVYPGSIDQFSKGVPATSLLQTEQKDIDINDLLMHSLPPGQYDVNVYEKKPHMETHEVSMSSSSSTDNPDGVMHVDTYDNVDGHEQHNSQTTTLNGRPLTRSSPGIVLEDVPLLHSPSFATMDFDMVPKFGRGLNDLLKESIFDDEFMDSDDIGWYQKHPQQMVRGSRWTDTDRESAAFENRINQALDSLDERNPQNMQDFHEESVTMQRDSRHPEGHVHMETNDNGKEEVFDGTLDQLAHRESAAHGARPIEMKQQHKSIEGQVKQSQDMLDNLKSQIKTVREQAMQKNQGKENFLAKQRRKLLSESRLLETQRHEQPYLGRFKSQ